ncbi:hypothetical protein L226DRAFT_396081 [Lentinus tigrinus ALCF2SS1-7]|uniref:uncharacterized protein n=1 Tax=Lentinus tigrinus ALCF2SS1-7 TaxID=1328758 RepID=UPI0011663FED|nr:hypothetical protein L226DRAFT_396081 [Lentinus tigrinus ALCF2SS1-7]
MVKTSDRLLLSRCPEPVHVLVQTFKTDFTIKDVRMRRPRSVRYTACIIRQPLSRRRQLLYICCTWSGFCLCLVVSVPTSIASLITFAHLNACLHPPAWPVSPPDSTQLYLRGARRCGTGIVRLLAG